MYARRLAPAMALLLALMPASDAIAGDAGRAPSRAAEPPATRADVLAGRATQDQALDLLKTSIERAGGTTVDDSIAPESTPPPEPLGGYVYPLLASDLDGDGDDEVVLEQWSDTDHVLAVDDRGILWREALPDGTFLVGAFVADLIEGGAEELLLVAYRYEVPGLGFLAAAGADGFVWRAEIPTNYLEINGLVQADADALPEVAVTGWDLGWESTLYTFDGEDGSMLAAMRSTPNDLVGGFYSQVFVTDAEDQGTDEAIFVTPLTYQRAGYYTERRSLADGSVLGVSIIGNATFDELYQGPDFTGDGRRDALALQYGPPVVGVFDGDSMSMKWGHTFTAEEDVVLIPSPYEGGDIDGDGGIELCLVETTYSFSEEEIDSDSAAVGCYAGASGTELWRVERTIGGEDHVFAYAWAGPDIDGNGIVDALIESGEYRCEETPDDYWCETLSYEAVALSGVDGSPLWTINEPEQESLVYGLTDSNLDGTPGDDALGYLYSEEETPDAPFEIRNGMTLSRSWGAVIDTGELPGYADRAIDADVDGDGSTDAVITAEAYEATGEIICDYWDGEEYCYEEYIEHAYVAAFEPGGELLWQLEL